MRNDVTTSCADSDPAVHGFFMDSVFPGRGFAVLPCAGWPAQGPGTPG
ncbi:hypothetical protein [Prauserella shujinwangii]|nr:hypothetical protein [Prauserella shujinwangii]